MDNQTDLDTLSFNKALELFKLSEGYEPQLINKNEATLIAGLQGGIKEMMIIHDKNKEILLSRIHHFGLENLKEWIQDNLILK